MTEATIEDRPVQAWVHTFRPHLFAFAHPTVGRSVPWVRRQAMRVWAWLLEREALRRAR